MSWSFEDMRAHLETLLEKCSDQVLHEMEEEILRRLRTQGRQMIEEIFQRSASRLDHPSINEIEYKNFDSTEQLELELETKKENPLMDSQRVWYGYCIIPEGSYDLSTLKGLDESSCFLLRHDVLNMVVCTLPKSEYSEQILYEHMQDLKWVEIHAKAHEAVLLFMMEKTPLLPLPFCTLFCEENSVIAQLADKKDILLRELAKVTNCKEWILKLYVRADYLQNKLGKSDLIPQDRGGSSYFLRLQKEKQLEQEFETIVETYGEKLLETLREISEDVILMNSNSVPKTEGLCLVFAAQFLILADNHPLWEQKLTNFDHEADEWGFMMELTGPLPPYHFTGLEEE